jgi:hypothetical protein
MFSATDADAGGLARRLLAREPSPRGSGLQRSGGKIT